MYRLLLNMVAKVGVVVMMLLVAAGCDEVSVEQIKSNAYIQTEDVKGESKY